MKQLLITQKTDYISMNGNNKNYKNHKPDKENIRSINKNKKLQNRKLNKHQGKQRNSQ